MSYRVSCNEKVIHYVSAPCSTGKTYAACRYISENQYVGNHLYIAPSLRLFNEVNTLLQGMGVQAKVITSETHPKCVKRAIIEFLKSALDCGHVLLITWNAFIDLPYFNRRDNWKIVVDELPQVDSFYRMMLPRNYGFISEHLEVFPTHYAGLSLVKAKKTGRLKRLLDAPLDEVHELFRALFRDVLSSNKSVYVDTESWHRVVELNDVSDQHEKNTIYFLSMLKPDPLIGTVLLGANLEDSMLFRWFKEQGVRFTEENGIARKLRKTPEDLGERIRISYFITGRHMSKTLSAKEAKDGGILIDRMDELAWEQFGDEQFVYISNNDRSSDLIDNAPNATPAPVVSNGLNSLQDHHNIYFSASLNREPKHFSMLKSVGLTSELVHKSTAHETCYQGVMRTSLRNPDSTEKVHAIVPDQPTAERLGGLLGCTDIRCIGDIVPSPKKPLSQTDRSRRHQFGRLKEGIFSYKGVLEFVPDNQQSSFINQYCLDSGAFQKSPANLTWYVTFHKTVWDDEAKDFHVLPYELHDFIREFRKSARTKIDCKDDLILWNPATFDPKGGEGYRRQEYFIQSSCLVLDFDDGTLSPEEFEDIFWHKAKRGEKHSFVIHNSFSRSEDQPNKFRVILFYQQPAQSIEDHKAAYRYVVRRLEACGHTEQSAQLDTACRSGNQPFWVPSTNRAHEEFVFFREFGTKTRDLVRCAIDPFACPREVKFSEFSPDNTPPQPAIKQHFLDKAAVIAGEFATMTSGRHNLFFRYGVCLAKGGLLAYEIESSLLICAGQETKMKKKVAGVMKSLKKYGLI